MRTFYPTTSLQRHKVTATALLTIIPKSSEPQHSRDLEMCCSQQLILLFPGSTATGNPCSLLQLPGLRQLSHNIKEQKLNQVICQVIKTELEQSLRNTSLFVI